MSSVSRSSLPLSENKPPSRGVRVPRGCWESSSSPSVGRLISGLLFATAVSPAVVARPWPSLIFVGSLAVSALLAPWLATDGARRSGRARLAARRGVGLALLPVVELTGGRALLGRRRFRSHGARRAARALPLRARSRAGRRFEPPSSCTR